MDKQCLECLSNKPKKDNQIQNLLLQLEQFKQIFIKTDIINKDVTSMNTELMEENRKVNLKLTQHKERLPYIVVGSFTIGVGATIYIFKKVVN